MTIGDLFPKYAGRKARFVHQNGSIGATISIPERDGGVFKYDDRKGEAIPITTDTLTTTVELIDPPPQTICDREHFGRGDL